MHVCGSWGQTLNKARVDVSHPTISDKVITTGSFKGFNGQFERPFLEGVDEANNYIKVLNIGTLFQYDQALSLFLCCISLHCFQRGNRPLQTDTTLVY